MGMVSDETEVTEGGMKGLWTWTGDASERGVFEGDGVQSGTGNREK